jgi:hypothetical protein
MATYSHEQTPFSPLEQFQDHLTRITIKIQVVYEWFSTLYIMYSTAPHAMAHWNLKCVHAQTRLSFTETLFI